MNTIAAVVSYKLKCDVARAGGPLNYMGQRPAV
jgi:hypothetical protein